MQQPLNTFIKIESIIEDHGLAHLMDEVSEDDELEKEEAIKFYIANTADK